MQDTLIARVLLVSPSQSELFRRNKSRIYFGVEGESLIDTILQQANRPIEDLMDVADRAIISAGLNEQYGDLRAVHASSFGAFGASHLTSTSWLKDENNNVYDLFISLEPSNELVENPQVEILPTISLQDGIEGENPLIMSTDVDYLSSSSGGSSEDTDQGDQSIAQTQLATTDNQSGDEDRQSGGQGRVKDPENDGRLKENRGGDANANREMADARQPAPDGGESRRGAVRSPHDRRLRGNRARATARQPQNND